MNFKSLIGIIIILFVGLAAFLHSHHIENEEHIVELSLLVGPILFGLFVAFSITERLSRIDKIRDFDSTERSSITMMSKTSELWDTHEQRKMHTLLDEYLMATLDYKIWDYDKTEKEFLRISDHVIQINKKNNHPGAEFQLRVLSKMLDARERTIALINDRLSAFEWIIYIFLGTLVMVPFVLANTGTSESMLLTLGLFVAVSMLLTFLYLLDSLKWKEEVRIFEPYQKTFESIGALRYFPEIIVQERRVKNAARGEYRLASLPDAYPDRTNKEVFIVDQEGNRLKFERIETHNTEE